MSGPTGLAAVIAALCAAYLAVHPLTVPEAKGWRAIVACRTAALGGHMEVCDGCGAVRHRYHSCRNRNSLRCRCARPRPPPADRLTHEPHRTAPCAWDAVRRRQRRRRAVRRIPPGNGLVHHSNLHHAGSCGLPPVQCVTDTPPQPSHWLANPRPELTIPLANVISRFSPTRFIRRHDRLYSPRAPSAADKRYSLGVVENEVTGLSGADWDQLKEAVLCACYSRETPVAAYEQFPPSLRESEIGRLVARALNEGDPSA